MEDSLLNQLPQADALPDGFCESTSETSNIRNLASDIERNLGLKENKSRALESNLQDTDIDEESTIQPGYSVSDQSLMEESGKVFDVQDVGSSVSDKIMEKAEKTRTFPVQLSHKDTCRPSQVCSGTLTSNETRENSFVDGQSSLDNSFCLTADPSAAPSTCIDALNSPSPSELDLASSGYRHDNQAETERVEPDTSNGIDDQNSNNTSKSSKVVKANDVKSRKGKGSSKLEMDLAYSQLILERDTAVNELKKNIAVREKLESLCRELQRQNKFLMDECRKVTEEGQQKRLELSSKFEDAIKDVNNKLEEQRDERLSQLKENEMLRSKLKQFSEQYEICEQQFTKQLKKQSLELQMAELKLKQQQEATCQEQAKVQRYAEQISQLLETEKNLRLQLAADGQKFQQFQETLAKSNEVFESFKKEMEKMAKVIKELSKENSFLKSKCEKTDVSLIELVDEREKLKKQLEKTKNQKDKLESLCRKLQAERKLQDTVIHMQQGDDIAAEAAKNLAKENSTKNT